MSFSLIDRALEDYIEKKLPFSFSLKIKEGEDRLLPERKTQRKE